MKLASAPKRAADIGDRSPKAAASLYNEIEYELALGDPSPQDEAAGESALRILRANYPDVQSQAREVQAPPSLSRTAKDNAHSEGRRRRASAPSKKTSSSSSSARRDPVIKRAPAPAPRRAPGVSSRRGAKRAITRTAGYVISNGASSASDWGSVVMQFVLGGVLLSLGYLLLTKSKGTSALFTGLTNTVKAVVSPTVDPLNPHGAIA
jgi:hypothetical protein